MAMSTRDELKTAISAALEEEDLDDYIDDFITSAEDLMEVEVRIRELLVHKDDFTLSDGDRYEAFPSDFMDVKFLRLRTPTGYSRRYFPRLDELSIDQLSERSRDQEDRPRAFCVHTQFEFDAECDQDYTGELFYYKKFSRLSDDVDSNEILDAYPSLYLYGALQFAEPWLVADERISTWRNFYVDLKDKANDKAIQNSYAGPRKSRVPNLPRRA